MRPDKPVNYGWRDISPGRNADRSVFIYNGFSGNGNDVALCALGNFNVQDNPDFVSEVIGAEDFHLLCSSPMINAGNPAQAFNDLDGSINDMGAYGGQLAGEFDREGFEDYCLIPGGTNLQDVGGQPGLEPDTYEMTGNCQVPPGETLTIPGGTTIILHPDVFFKVTQARILVQGTGWADDERVLFRGITEPDQDDYIPDNPHLGVIIDGGIQGSPHSITFCEIRGSDDSGLKISGGAVFGAEMFQNNRLDHNRTGLLVSASTVDIEDSEFFWNEDYGVRLSNCGLNVSIFDCEVYENYERGIYSSNSLAFLVNTLIRDNGWQGVFLYNCDGLSILGCSSQDNWMKPGQPNYSNPGFYLDGTNAEFDVNGDIRCEAIGNRSAGLMCYYTSTPILQHTTLMNNNIITVLNDGAEIELSSSSFVEMLGDAVAYEQNDQSQNIIQDYDVNEFLLIKRSSLPVTRIDGRFNYWCSEDEIQGTEMWEVCYPTSEGNPNSRLLTPATFDDDYIHVDDEDETRIPWRLVKEGIAHLKSDDPNSALRMFESVIQDYPESPAAGFAVGSVCRCFSLCDRSVEDLNRYLERIEIPENATGLQDKIFYSLTFNHLLLGDYEYAIRSFENRVGNARSVNDSMRAVVALEETILAQMIERGDGDLDVLFEIDIQTKRLNELHKIAEDVDMDVISIIPREVIPEQFKILSTYPNPFNSSVAISYSQPFTAVTTIAIYDLEGREVISLFKGKQLPGYYRQTWIAGDLPSGLYLCKINVGSEAKTIKLNLLK